MIQLEQRPPFEPKRQTTGTIIYALYALQAGMSLLNNMLWHPDIMIQVYLISLLIFCLLVCVRCNHILYVITGIWILLSTVYAVCLTILDARYHMLFSVFLLSWWDIMLSVPLFIPPKSKFLSALRPIIMEQSNPTPYSYPVTPAVPSYAGPSYSQSPQYPTVSPPTYHMQPPKS